VEERGEPRKTKYERRNRFKRQFPFLERERRLGLSVRGTSLRILKTTGKKERTIQLPAYKIQQQQRERKKIYLRGVRIGLVREEKA